MHSSDFITIEGSCHCRNIRFVLQWPKSETEIRARECGCSFCTKRGGAWTSHPEAGLSARIDDLSRVSKYRFGTSTADFHVCSICGVVPFVTSDIDGETYAVVNVNAFDSLDASTLPRASTDFDGERTGDRLDRRKRNWIGKVRIDAATD